jgi:hypothetical protein
MSLPNNLPSSGIGILGRVLGSLGGVVGGHLELIR